MKTVSCLSLLALLSSAACASADSDAPVDGKEALRGAPEDPAVRVANEKMTSFVFAIDTAYLDAKETDFVQVRADVLPGDARTTLLAATRSCAARGPTVAAWSWTANVPASPDDLTRAPRQLYVVATTARPGKPMGIAVHDARGTFVWGRRYYDWRDDYEPGVDKALVEAIRGCFW